MNLFLLTLVFVPALAAEDAQWTYKGAINCLKALHAEIKPADSMIAFDKYKVGVMRAARGGEDGFMAFTEKSAFFVPFGELSQSGDGSTGESKVTIVAPAKEFAPIKFFFKSGSPKSTGQISFTLPNEFDRPVTTTPVPDEHAKGPLNLAIDTAFKAASPQVKTNPVRFGKALDVCGKTDLDFKLTAETGIESTLKIEMQRAKDKMRPGIFSKDRWLPKKDGAG